MNPLLMMLWLLCGNQVPVQMFVVLYRCECRCWFIIWFWTRTVLDLGSVHFSTVKWLYSAHHLVLNKLSSSSRVNKSTQIPHGHPITHFSCCISYTHRSLHRCCCSNVKSLTGIKKTNKLLISPEETD